MVKVKKGKTKRSAAPNAAPESSKVTDVPAIIGEYFIWHGCRRKPLPSPAACRRSAPPQLLRPTPTTLVISLTDRKGACLAGTVELRACDQVPGARAVAGPAKPRGAGAARRRGAGGRRRRARASAPAAAVPTARGRAANLTVPVPVPGADGWRPARSLGLLHDGGRNGRERAGQGQGTRGRRGTRRECGRGRAAQDGRHGARGHDRDLDERPVLRGGRERQLRRARCARARDRTFRPRSAHGTRVHPHVAVQVRRGARHGASHLRRHGGPGSL